MRALTATQVGLLAAGDGKVAGAVAERMRVQVKDGGGTFRDLSTYGGINFVDSAQWQEDIDSPHATATVTLKREIEQFSIAPLVQNSALNHAFSPSSSYSALIALNRELKIEVAMVPMDSAPKDADWFPVFHGYIDTIDPGGETTLALSCRDLGARVQDAFIDTERVYAFTGGSTGYSMRLWEPNTNYAAGEYILPASRGQHEATDGTVTDDPGRGKFYKIAYAGISGTTEPVWAASGADGTAAYAYEGTTSLAGVNVEAVMQQMLNDNGLSSVTLDVPNTPAWSITQFIQKRQPVLEALRALAIQIGWDVRYVWKSSASAYVLRFFQPDRSKTDVDHTFNSKSWSRISKFATDISGIRNVVRVIYSANPAEEAAWPDGTCKRKIVEFPYNRSSSSITAYGVRFMEIAESSTSQIDTSAEAEKMAVAALQDLANPVAAVSIELVTGYPWVELGDRYTLAAAVTAGDVPNQIFSGDQTLAVFGYSHSAEGGRIKTTINLRGQPSLGLDRWEAASARANPAGVHKLQELGFPIGGVRKASPIVGGVRIDIIGANDKLALPAEYEHHVSTTNNFSPDIATLVGVTKSKSIDLPSLIPGQTYYHRMVARAHNSERLVRSEPTPQLPFVAAQAQAVHINPELDLTSLPLNGGFETWLDGDAAPDLWTQGMGFNRVSDGNGISGRYYIRAWSGPTSQSLYSAYFPVTTGQVYRLSVWSKGSSGTANFTASVQWSTYDQTYDSQSSSVTLPCNGAAWKEYSILVTAPANARFGRVRVLSPGVSTAEILLDRVMVQQDISVIAAGSLVQRPLSARTTDTLNVKDFGAKGDGESDDTAAIQAAIDASPHNGYTLGTQINFPPGTYKVTDSILINAWWGVRLVGASKASTCLQASGTGWSSKALVVFQHSMHCSLENIQLSVDNVATPSEAVFMSSNATSAGHQGPNLNINSRNSLRNVQIWHRDLSGRFNYGVRIGGDVDANNDFHLFDNVEIMGCTTAGVLGQNTQAVDHTFIHCFILSCATGVDLGSFSWFGGAVGASSSSDFALGAGQSAGCGVNVYGGNSEGSARLLRTNTAPGVYHNVTFRNFRWASTGTLHADGYAVVFERGGNLVIENCLFSEANAVPKILLSSVRTTTGRICNNLWNCAAVSTTPINPIVLSSYAHNTGYPGGTHGVERYGNSYFDPASYIWPVSPEAASYPTYATSAPTDGTWFKGQQVINTATAASGNIGWVCTTSGRFGTYSEGRTATANGTTSITLSASSGELLVGDFVTINSVATRITAISGTTVTMANAVTTGGPGLAIAYTTPVFKTFGAISA